MNTSTTWLTRLTLAATLSLSAVSLAAQQETPAEPAESAVPAVTNTVEGLPDEAPREGTVVTVDVSTNRLYLFRDGQLVSQSLVATGSDKVLKKGTKTWWFRTPRGRHVVKRRISAPIWTKPDWAFIEEGKKVPPPDSPQRKVKGKLGKYALDLGDGILIHGTDDPSSFGRKASHGCIRAPEKMLDVLWKEVKVGTQVVIFESQPALVATGGAGLNDLDFTGGVGGRK